MMRKKLKGAIGTIVVLTLGAVVVFGGGFVAGMWWGRNHGGNSGGDAVQADATVAETSNETSVETTSEMTTTTQLSEFVKIFIKGSTYYYNDEPIELDNLIDELKNNELLEVRVSCNVRTTQFAYEQLINKLEENEIYYVEDSD